MRAFLIFATGLSIAAAPAFADSPPKVPVDVVDSRAVQVSGAVAERRDDGVITHGWVRRRFGAYGLFDAHLHVEGLNDKGAPLALLGANWNGSLGTRTRPAKAFRAQFDPSISNQIERVRVSIQPGRRHDDKN